MREVLSVHEPLLVNTLGHCAGTLIFATFLMLLLRDRAGSRLGDSRRTIAAATVALLWNVLSLLVIAYSDRPEGPPESLTRLSTSALSVLPAILLHLSLGPSFRWIRLAGYGVSALAVGYHASEVLLNAPENHLLALRLVTLGFGALTLIAAAALVRSGETRRLTSRLVGTMALFLFSISFVHFGFPHTHSWPMEMVAHHAGIPLALFVLLQDYRFLLLDAFVRFLSNMTLAGLAVIGLVTLVDLNRLLAWSATSPFRQGMLICAAAALLPAFTLLRAACSDLLTRLVFRRRSVDQVLVSLRESGAQLDRAVSVIGAFFDAEAKSSSDPRAGIVRPTAVPDMSPADRERLEAAGIEAVIPIHQPGAGVRYILLGRRQGGRRYLSEDFEAMSRMQKEIADQLERHHEAELRRLVSQAEIRALQAQIHPHFLFNAFNTLYGIIPREARGARQTVLNLADILRYFLKSERTYIPLREELDIIRAYLEIEALRLGDKLQTRIEVPPDALDVMIPVLTIEPLVENAVKHGVANQPEGGLVLLEVERREDRLQITVTDTGPGFTERTSSGTGVGLENVTRRLQLCYGAGAGLRMERVGPETRVAFAVPVAKPEAVAG